MFRKSENDRNRPSETCTIPSIWFPSPVLNRIPALEAPHPKQAVETPEYIHIKTQRNQVPLRFLSLSAGERPAGRYLQVILI